MERKIINEQYHKPFIDAKKNHILMITNHGMHQWQVDPGLPDTGGQNVFVNSMSKGLEKLGFKITIVNRGGYKHPYTKNVREGLDYLNESQRILYIEDSVKEFVRKEDMNERIPELLDFLKEALEEDGLDFDLIISHYWDAAKIGVELNKTLPSRKKHVWIPHSLGRLKKDNMNPSSWDKLRIDERISIEKALIPYLDEIGATSSTINHYLEKFYNHKTDVFLPPCINPETFYPKQVSDDDPIWDFLEENSLISKDEIRRKKIVTEMSRTDDTKKKDVLVKAFAKINEKYPDTFLILSLDANSKELYGKIKNLIKELKIEKSVVTLGSVWEWLPRIYAITYVYCTPSVMEGFGMAIQEAAATRVPAVSSDLVPFAVEYLLGKSSKQAKRKNKKPLLYGEGAIVVPANDVDGFTRGLESIISNHKTREIMAEHAYNITIPYFTWDHLIAEFLKKIGFSWPKGPFFMRHALTYDGIKSILLNNDVSKLSQKDIKGILEKEQNIKKFKPENICHIDPRNGDRIIYNSARARRPHENEEIKSMKFSEEDLNKEPSIISEGKTTGIIDLATLSDGFTFINFNLFPILYPAEGNKEMAEIKSITDVLDNKAIPIEGFHFLQWTSSFQDVDFHNMPLSDGTVVMKRLGVLEKSLLENKKGNGKNGFVSIIKNCGRLVGGSVAHGHQQITYSVIMPRRVMDLVNFEKKHKMNFASYMLQKNPKNLIIKDYGEAVLMVPYFMRRPYDMMLFLKDTEKKYLHELTSKELTAVAAGWRDGIHLMRVALKGLSKSIAYNILTNNGQGAGLYFDFLPYTQEMGGYEHLGLYVCQAKVKDCADYLKSVLKWERENE